MPRNLPKARPAPATKVPQPRPAPSIAPDMPPAPFWTGKRTAIAATFLLAVHASLAVLSLVRENPTVDEVVHLPAGIAYWQTGRFHLYHHNPPLVKLVAAVPVLLSNPNMTAPYQTQAWRSEFGSPTFFAQAFQLGNPERFFELFTRARLVMPAFSILGGLVVLAWSRKLYGNGGGVLSLALWALCPNVLAHGRLITSDVGATALGAGATYLFWRYLKSPTWRLASIAGLALGVAELSKFSLLILYALWPVLWLAQEVGRGDRSGIVRRTLRSAGQGAWIVALSMLMIDAGYLFDDVGIPLGRFDFACRTLTRPGVTPHDKTRNFLLDKSWENRVNRFRGTWLGSIPAPLPKHYLLGFDEQKIEADGIPRIWLDPTETDPDKLSGYPVYLDGTLRRNGWRDYYLRCLLYKVPEGTWLLVGLSLVVLFTSRRSRGTWADEFAILAPPASTFLAMTFLTDINLGLRYVLPMFPYVFIAAGKLAPWTSGLSGKLRTSAVATILGGISMTALATATIHPHYLAYFNLASGGPDRDPPRLIDSNLDWGQDLINLRKWMSDHEERGPIGLAYFGQVSPNLFAMRDEPIDWFLPPIRKGLYRPMYGREIMQGLRGPAPRLTPGLYAISASFVQGLPFRVDDPAPLRVMAAWQAEEEAFGYFRLLRPIDRIGHSILLYRVTEADIERIGPIGGA